MYNLPNIPELVLLKVLWRHGALPVRKLHDACSDDLKWSFSSTRKTIERMAHKKFVYLDNDSAHLLVVASVSKPRIISQFSQDFFGRVLELNKSIPMAAFADSQLLSDDELDEVEGLLGS